MKLFFDTETTGLINFKEPPDAQCQPRLVQIAAILSDEVGNEVDSINHLVIPMGFKIPREASDIHGITTEKATEHGVDIGYAISQFISLRNRADILVGHNINYDSFVMRGELIRLNMDYPEGKKEKFCTMINSTNICKIPSSRGYKFPRLQEAYKHAFGKEFEGAHDAMQDIQATKELYFWLIKQTGV